MDIYQVCEVIEAMTRYIEHGDGGRLISELMTELKTSKLNDDDTDRKYLQNRIDELERELIKKSI